MWFILFCPLLCVHCQVFAIDSGSFILATDLSDKSHRSDHDYLKIVTQFFESINLISFIFINSHERNASSIDLSNVLLKSLPESELLLECLLKLKFLLGSFI